VMNARSSRRSSLRRGNRTIPTPRRRSRPLRRPVCDHCASRCAEASTSSAGAVAGPKRRTPRLHPCDLRPRASPFRQHHRRAKRLRARHRPKDREHHSLHHPHPRRRHPRQRLRCPRACHLQPRPGQGPRHRLPRPRLPHPRPDPSNLKNLRRTHTCQLHRRTGTDAVWSATT
jgi:hypothetical protein